MNGPASGRAARIIACASIALLLVSCGPPLSRKPTAVPAEAVNPNVPLSAAFLDVTPAAPKLHELGPCSTGYIAVTHGTLRVVDAELHAGDLAIVEGRADVALRGNGTIVFAELRRQQCPAPLKPRLETVRANGATPLTFAGGKMTALLDAESAVSPDAYVGRLRGTVSVAEHTHETSWEILCAIHASGRFALGGAQADAARLGDRQVIVVPPNTKHAWKPDPGTELEAVQIYVPPGPEQRFKKLAADEATKKK